MAEVPEYAKFVRVETVEERPSHRRLRRPQPGRSVGQRATAANQAHPVKPARTGSTWLHSLSARARHTTKSAEVLISAGFRDLFLYLCNLKKLFEQTDQTSLLKMVIVG